MKILAGNSDAIDYNLVENKTKQANEESLHILGNLRQEIIKAEQKLDSLKQKVGVLEETEMKLDSDSLEKKKEIEGLEVGIKEMTEKHTSLTTAVETASNKLLGLSNELNEILKNIESKNSEYKELVNKVAKIDIESVQKRYEDTLTSIDSELKSFQSAKSQLETEISNLKDTKANLEAEKVGLGEAIHELQNNVDQLRNEKGLALEEVNKVNEELGEIKTQITENKVILEQSNDALQEVNDSIELSNEEKDKNIRFGNVLNEKYTLFKQHKNKLIKVISALQLEFRDNNQLRVAIDEINKL